MYRTGICRVTRWTDVTFGRCPFHDYFILSVAVNVAHRAVVGAVCVGHAVGSGAACRSVKVHLLIHFRPYGCLRRSLNHLSAVNCLNDILGIGRPRSVNIVGAAGYRLCVNLHSVTIHVIALTAFVRRQASPRQIDACLCLYGHESASERLGLLSHRRTQRCGKHQAWKKQFSHKI